MFVRLFRVRSLIIIIIMLIVYMSYNYLDLSGIILIYGGYGANGHAESYIITFRNVINKNNNSKFDGIFLNSSKSFLSSHHLPASDQSNINSNINIYFTVKTTPGNYEKRIRPLQISWFQKVNKEMFSLVSDPIQGNVSKDSKVKQLEMRLKKEGFKVALSTCPIIYGRKTLCCKSGLEFEQYYQYIEKHKGDRDNWPQWFCHVDDDVYVNVEQIKRLLLQYDSRKPYYVGRHWRTEYGLTVDNGRLNQLKKFWHVKGERRKFWHAAGPTYCLSHPLMMELKDFFKPVTINFNWDSSYTKFGSQRFMNTCDIARYADDFTVGAITGVVLGYNITHTTEFDYDRIDLRFVSTETITKMATINYKYNKETGKIWRSKINPKLRIFSDEVDPPGVLSLHCLLYNDTSWCPSKSSNISSVEFLYNSIQATSKLL